MPILIQLGLWFTLFFWDCFFPPPQHATDASNTTKVYKESSAEPKPGFSLSYGASGIRKTHDFHGVRFRLQYPPQANFDLIELDISGSHKLTRRPKLQLF